MLTPTSFKVPSGVVNIYYLTRLVCGCRPFAFRVRAQTFYVQIRIETSSRSLAVFLQSTSVKAGFSSAAYYSRKPVSSYWNFCSRRMLTGRVTADLPPKVLVVMTFWRRWQTSERRPDTERGGSGQPRRLFSRSTRSPLVETMYRDGASPPCLLFHQI